MPFYEYKCESCNNVVETMRPFADMNKPMPCTECGGMCKITPSIPSPFTGGPARSNRGVYKTDR